MLCTPKTLLAAALTLPLVLSAPLRAEDWPQWRGPNRDGVWHETDILESFPAGGLKVRWRVPVGWGYLTDCDGTLPKAKERILCLEESTGTPLWDFSMEVTYTKDTYFVDKNGHPTIPGQTPTSTPLVNSGKVYSVGMPGNVI